MSRDVSIPHQSPFVVEETLPPSFFDLAQQRTIGYHHTGVRTPGQGFAKPSDGGGFRAVAGDGVANPGRLWPEPVASIGEGWVERFPRVENPETADPAEVEHGLAGAKALNPLDGAVAIAWGQRSLRPQRLPALSTKFAHGAIGRKDRPYPPPEGHVERHATISDHAPGSEPSKPDGVCQATTSIPNPAGRTRCREWSPKEKSADDRLRHLPEPPMPEPGRHNRREQHAHAAGAAIFASIHVAPACKYSGESIVNRPDERYRLVRTRALRARGTGNLRNASTEPVGACLTAQGNQTAPIIHDQARSPRHRTGQFPRGYPPQVVLRLRLQSPRRARGTRSGRTCRMVPKRKKCR